MSKHYFNKLKVVVVKVIIRLLREVLAILVYVCFLFTVCVFLITFDNYILHKYESTKLRVTVFNKSDEVVNVHRVQVGEDNYYMRNKWLRADATDADVYGLTFYEYSGVHSDLQATYHYGQSEEQVSTSCTLDRQGTLAGSCAVYLYKNPDRLLCDCYTGGL